MSTALHMAGPVLVLILAVVMLLLAFKAEVMGRPLCASGSMGVFALLLAAFFRLTFI